MNNDLFTIKAEWEFDGIEPVPMNRWGKDHWTTFAYVEDAWVNHSGLLDHDRLRCDRSRHPMFYASKRMMLRAGSGSADGSRYATRLKTEELGDNGLYGAVDLFGHDDYDCLNDAIVAGLIEVRMPEPREPHHDVYLDARGKVARIPGGEAIEGGPMTGLRQLWLMTAASFRLTELGQDVARELRAFWAAGNNSHQFVPSAACLLRSGKGAGQ
jgi:hypothetical protein